MSAFIPIPSTLAGLDIPPVDIFRRRVATDDTARSETVLYRDKHLPVGGHVQSDLSAVPEGELYIRAEDLNKFLRHLEGVQRKMIKNASVPLETKAELIQVLGVKVAQEIFHSPKKEEMLRARDFCSSLADMIIGHQGAFHKLLGLAHHDEYTYQHSLSVAGLAVGVSRMMGLTDPVFLTDAAIAGFLHDVGKAKIPWTIINKPGKLSETEWKSMQLHSLFGYQLTQHVQEIPARSKLAILQHHEAPGGVGYPAGLEGSSLDILTKIITACDIFSALTTNRSYSQARSTFEALKLMQEIMIDKLDRKVFQTLVLALSERADKL